MPLWFAETSYRQVVSANRGTSERLSLEMSSSRLLGNCRQSAVIEDQDVTVVRGRERLRLAVSDADWSPLGVGCCAGPDLSAATDTDKPFAVRRYGDEIERRRVVQRREGGTLVSADL